MREAIAPTYLVTCLMLGGSAQGIWQGALLQIAGVAIIVWAAAWPPNEPFPRNAKPLIWLTIAALVIVALQCVPLPPSVWARGARQHIADGYEILGSRFPWLPVSLTPYKGLSSLLALIPPAAMFCAIVRLRAYRSTWLAIALLAGTIAGVVLGILQVVGTETQPRWYPYPETNIGSAVGFFANANHMAMLLVIALPFLAAIGSTERGRSLQRASALLASLAGVGLLLIIGIALNGSIAAFVLGPAAIAASAMILFRLSPTVQKGIFIGAVALLLGGLALLSAGSVGETKLGSDTHESFASRADILRTTTRAVLDHFPLGSGLGSFRQVYRTYERPEAVTNEYVIHAHNDYVELVLELGAAGILLIAGFLVWWGSAVWAVWFRGEGGPYVRAASIGSAVLLAHSLVEFPLRTGALSVFFAVCLALLADRRRSQWPQAADLRPTRHVVIG
jgi:O-antigen ligase